ncbi:MAG: hypothetical protein ACRCSB_00650, partial [Bacteroidales bacterium]
MTFFLPLQNLYTRLSLPLSMPHYSLQQIASTIKGKANNKKNPNISHLLLDSRRLFSPDTSLFFAL